MNANSYPPCYAPAFEALARMQQTGRPAIIGLDGRSASGKTTLAGLLADALDANVFHMDEFFLPAEKRTPLRMAQPGGNIEYERLIQEVLIPVSEGKETRYHIYNCRSGHMTPALPTPFKPLTIIEGSYSLQPALFQYYSYRIFLTHNPSAQSRRLDYRMGAAEAAMFKDRWITLEERYFSELAVADQCDLLLDTSHFW